MSETNETIAILGGTGDQGLGLALRFCQSGRRVVIGSRKAERAVQAAENVRGQVPGADVEGIGNQAATAAAQIVILSVPFEHTASTVKTIKESLRAGQVLVSMAVPLATAVGDGAVRTVGIWQGSAAELVASLVPKGVDVVSAFQNVSAHRLQQLAEPVECDVVVSGPKAARQKVMDLCPLIPGLRALDGGGLSNARIVESMTALLIGLNIRHKCPEGLGIRFTGLAAGE
jgi:NADPH-dependent F420 reductase